MSIVQKEVKDKMNDNKENIKLMTLHGDLLYEIADIIRTSPIINKNYPHGYRCDDCVAMKLKCTCDSDGEDCNFAIRNYLIEQLGERWSHLKTESLAKRDEDEKCAGWSYLGGDEWCCTNCGIVITTENRDTKPTMRYCFECGFKMNVDAEN